MAVREMSDRKGIKFDGLEEFENWVETAPQLSNPALLEKCQEKSNECMERALLWSIPVSYTHLNVFVNVKMICFYILWNRKGM